MNQVYSPSTVGDIIRTQGSIRPDAAAILAPGLSDLRWGALSELLHDVEADLREFGIGPQHSVGVALPNGPEVAAVFLAVASCAVCAPLNPRLTERDLANYLAALGAKAVIVGEGMPAVEARFGGIPILRLARQPERGAGGFRLKASGRQKAAGGQYLPEGTALVLPTSGTTGRSKLVPLSHRNLIAAAKIIGNTLALTESDRCLNTMPLFHIHGLIAAVLSSLAAGGSVICAPGFSARDFLSWLNGLHPTWYTAVPAIHQSVLQSMVGARESIATGLRFIRSSSAALPPRVMADLESLFEVPVIEAYGMTEAAHQMASNPLPPGVRKPGSVGLPSGPEIALIDDQGRLPKEGGTGEIVIRGESVMGGYLKDPAANQEAFRDGWFRTGDYGRFDTDGYLHLAGRIQEVINRGGEKIAPRDIEDVLQRHPAVAQAVSFGVPHQTLGEDVGAAVTIRPGFSLTSAELGAFAADHLPAYKVPRRIHLVPEIPKGATGKIQRIGLHEQLEYERSGEPSAPEGYAPLETELEERMAQVWQETLGVDRVSGTDDFFALGGDSLSAVEMLERVSVEEDIELPQISLYECPTLRAFSEVVGNARGARGRMAGRSRGLAPIRIGGMHPPLFVATNHIGRFWQFARLARHMGPDQPVLGFPPPVLDHARTNYRIGELAASFVELIRKEQPQGPYSLLGDCLGGFIVFESALRLEAAGERIAFLGLMNTYRSSSGVGRRKRDRRLGWNSFRRRLTHHSRTMSELSTGKLIPFVAGRGWALLRRMVRATEWRCYRFLVRNGFSVPQSLLRSDFASDYALERYRPSACRGRAVLIRTIDDRSEDQQMGWQGLFGGPVDIIRVAHDLWTEEGVAMYGPEISRRLAQARLTEHIEK